jgi:hypothetical protein
MNVYGEYVILENQKFSEYKYLAFKELTLTIFSTFILNVFLSKSFVKPEPVVIGGYQMWLYDDCGNASH